uniref:Charged multivesicular body protein 2a n=1 Tax=Parascaris equorum TaxID=6256 RepID=A0A914RCE3_PAREQ
MEFLFGRRKTPTEMLRQNQRALNKAMRELDRERSRLEMQEKKIIADIKKMARMNQMDSVKVMAKDLVRTRRYVKKFIMMKANIQAVSLKVQTLKSQDAMAQAMKGVTRAMQSMNNGQNYIEYFFISEVLKEEMMGEAIDDAIADEGDEEESEAIVAQTRFLLALDELKLFFPILIFSIEI